MPGKKRKKNAKWEKVFLFEEEDHPEIHLFAERLHVDDNEEGEAVYEYRYRQVGGSLAHEMDEGSFAYFETKNRHRRFIPWERDDEEEEGAEDG